MMPLKIINSTLITVVCVMTSLCLDFYYPQIKNPTKATIYKDSTKTLILSKNIQVKEYFQYIDSIVNNHNAFNSYKITEHVLVRNNTWIIDTLQNTDYYRMKARDSFVYDQQKMIALPKGAAIVIPDSATTKKILNSFQKTAIDINIPEFKLRIFEDSNQLYEFPVRVGRDEKKYLAMAGRTLDLKTKTGKGTIVAHVRNPDYYNPADGKQYFVTKRDDSKVTKLPQIPFIETETNGLRNGQLIHPTTNPVTLSRAYSNGCIGTKEADAWVIYYYAPIGTKLNIRYNTTATDENGNEVTLKDIYNYKNGLNK
jgi:L,D-transpeptidase ErfK/SrfK